MSEGDLSEISTENTYTKTKTETDSSNMEENKAQICSFYLEGRCRFGDSCFNLHPADITVTPKTGAQKKTEEHGETEQCLDEKKPPLKTAGDVRKRIQWDPDLPKEYFNIGYLDRFSGVVEKPFCAFSWEHISTVDLDQLAVPQHRIQYFKYRDEKVWDKNERLDHVFGSAGNVTTIHEVIDRVEAQIAAKDTTFYPDDESDDDFEVLGAGNEFRTCQPTKEEQRRASHFFCIKVNNQELKRNIKTVQERVIQEEPVLRGCVMPSELLHVTLAMVDFETPEALEQAADMLQGVQEQLKMHLESNKLDIQKEDLNRSKNIEGCREMEEENAIKMVTAEKRDELQERNDSQKKMGDGEENEGKIRENGEQERLILARGLSTFGARVLFAQLEVPESFKLAVQILNEGIKKIPGAFITNHFDFVPHMTLLKVNRYTARERRSKYINSCLYSDFIDFEFGAILFDNIHLCAIEDLRRDDGFYVTSMKVEF